MTGAIALPDSRFDVASFGELVSDASRVTMLLSLMDGRARPATELARLAGVAPQTASSHLARLVAGGLLRAERQGRHRYFRLAGDAVADALEAVSLLSPPPRPLPARPARALLSRGRLCYRHLAGLLGVELLAALERARFLGVRAGALALTGRGAAWLDASAPSGRRSPARWPQGKPCLDWTERRPHLGGPLGALLTERLFAREWIARRDDGRAVRVTASGRRELARLGLPAAALSPTELDR
jgi:DNA-binding transcriptional ArsR family regulator